MGLHIKSRDIKRLKDILLILSEEGFHIFLKDHKLLHYLPLPKRFKKGGIPNPKQLKNAFERLGPVFIKFGQVLSSRPDFIPLEYANELKNLQQNIPPIPFSTIKKIVNEEIEMSKFSFFSKVPIATGSLAQVHKAKIDNKKVAVKVLKPQNEKIEVDLEIITAFAQLLNERFKKYRPLEAVNYFSEVLKKELDMVNEARHYDTFCELFSKKKSIIFPRPFWEFTTKNVLVMDFVQGKELNEAKNKKHIALKIMEAFLDMISKHGFFHADLHPGNIKVSGNSIIILDAGMTGFISSEMRKNIEKIFYSLFNKDFNGMAEGMLNVSTTSKESNSSEFKKEVVNFASSNFDPVLGRMSMKDTLLFLISSAVKNKIYPDTVVILLIRSAGYVDSIMRDLYPDVSLEKDLLPLFRNSRSRVIKETAKEYSDVLREVPKTFMKLSKKLDGGLNLELHHKELISFESVLDRTGTNITLGFIIAGFLILSGLTSSIEPKIGSFSLISLISILISLIFITFFIYRLLSGKKVWEEI